MQGRGGAPFIFSAKDPTQKIWPQRMILTTHPAPQPSRETKGEKEAFQPQQTGWGGVCGPLSNDSWMSASGGRAAR